MQMSKKELRQTAYLKRSAVARRTGRFLMPAAAVLLASAIWDDPVLGPQLAQGLEEVRPTAARYLIDTPLHGMLGPVPQDQVAGDIAEDARLAAASRLPQITPETN